MKKSKMSLATAWLVVFCLITLLTCEKSTMDQIQHLVGEVIAVDEVFPIYTYDISVESTIVSHYYRIGRSATLDEKVRLLSMHIADNFFEGLALTVFGIQSEGALKILHIGLMENDVEGESANLMTDIYKSGWNKYIQGSTGALTTRVAIEENLLQRNIQGEWIEGIRFYYGVMPIDEPVGHIENWDRIVFRNNPQ